MGISNHTLVWIIYVAEAILIVPLESMLALVFVGLWDRETKQQVELFFGGREGFNLIEAITFEDDSDSLLDKIFLRYVCKSIAIIFWPGFKIFHLIYRLFNIPIKLPKFTRRR